MKDQKEISLARSQMYTLVLRTFSIFDCRRTLAIQAICGQQLGTTHDSTETTWSANETELLAVNTTNNPAN